MVNRIYPIAHHDTVLASGTKFLSFGQPEYMLDLSDGNESGVRFNLDVHGTQGSFDSYKLTCKFQLGMFDVDGAGFTQVRWYDLQKEQIATMIQEGVDWYGGSIAPPSVKNLLTNPSWATSTGGIDVPGKDGAVTPSRPTDGGYIRGVSRRRITWTQGTSDISGGMIYQEAVTLVTAGNEYSASLAFAISKPQRMRMGIRWYGEAGTLKTDYGNAKDYPATDIRNAHVASIIGIIAPPGATKMGLYIYAVPGTEESIASPWQAGDWLDMDGMIAVEGTYLPTWFDGDAPNAVWDGAAHSSTSTLTIKNSTEANVVAKSIDSLPVTVSRSIKGFGHFVRVYIKPVFVNGSADAGIIYSLNAVH